MKKITILFIVKILGAILSLLLGILISRFYGVAVYGEYGVVITSIMIFSLIATWGGNVYIVENSILHINKQMAVKLIMISIIVTFISFLFFYWKYEVVYLGFVIFFFSFLNIKSSILMNNNKQIINSIIDDLLRYLVPIFLILWFHFHKESGYSVYLIYFFSMLFLFLLSLSIIYKVGIKSNRKINDNNIKIFNIKYGVIPTLSALLILLNSQFDRIILSYTTTKEDVGIYLMAYNFVSLVLYFSTSVMLVITPKIIKLYQDGEYDNLNLLCKKCSLLLIIITSCILFSSLFFSDFYFELYNVDRKDGVICLLILLLGVLISNLFGFGITLASYSKYKNRLFMYQIVVLVFYVFSCYILSIHIGIIGAAISTALSLIIIKLLLWNFYRKKGIKVGVF